MAQSFGTSRGFGSSNPSGRSLTPAEEQSALAKLGTQGGQFVSDLMWGLGTPGATIASVIDYAQDGEWNNPLDPEQRVGGEKILENAGMEDGTARWLGGAGLDILTDPLTWLGGPTTALGKGGRVAQAAGILDDAAAVASRKVQKDALAGAVSQYGSSAASHLDDVAATLPARARRTLKATDSDIASYIDHDTRPLVGQRAALRGTTLEDVMARADQRTRDSINAHINAKGWDYDAIKSEPLGKSFGIAGTSINFDPLGASAGEAMAAGMDRVGEALRWSPAGVRAHSLFNKAVGGQTDAVAQAAAERISQAAEVGESRGRSGAADLAYDLTRAKIDPAVAQRTGIDDVFSPKAADAIDRYIEKVAMTAADKDFVENTPGVKAFIDKWGAYAPDALARSKDSGLRAHQLDHAFGAGYRPYQMESLLDRAAAGKTGKVALFDMVTGDMLARKRSLQLPGGVDQLRALSQDPRFVGLGTAFKEDDVADILFKEINDPNNAYYQSRSGSPAAQWAAATAGGNSPVPIPKYSRGKARQLARFLHGLEATKDAAGNITSPPAFGNHALEATSRYMVGRERAIDTSDAVLDTIASKLIEGPAGQVAGGKHISASNALQRAGFRSPLDTTTNLRGGAAMKLREKIAAKLNSLGQNVSPDKIDLSKYSISEDHINSLTRMHDFYAQPKAVSELSQWLNSYTKVFKAQVLTWPSRFTRDKMSGFVTNVIEAGPAAALEGEIHAAKLLDGKYEEVLPYLRQMPLYSSITDDERLLKQFLIDSADAKILRGGSINDVASGDRTAASIQKLLPGQTPQSFVKSFDYDPNRKWGEAFDLLGVRGAFGRKDTTNAIYKTGEALGDWTDSTNRMAGYMALLKQGVSPQEAARRMGAAHVLYDNLSTFEKQIRDQWMPFWAYSSRIGKYVVDSLMTRPGGAYGQMLRLVDKAQQTDDDTYVPTTMREQTGFALPPELGEFTESLGLGNVSELGDGSRRFVKNLDLPGLSVLNMLSTAKTGGVIDPGASVVSTVQNVAQQLAPHLRTGLELITQRDMHTKRRLGEVPTEIEAIVGSLTGDKDFRVPGLVNTAIDAAVPGASRVLSFGRQLTDDRIADPVARVGQAAWNQVAPFRFGVVDPKRAESDAVRQIDEELRRSGHARTMDMTTVSEEDFQKLSPQLQQYYLLRRGIQSKRSKEARAKQEAAAKRAARFGG